MAIVVTIFGHGSITLPDSTPQSEIDALKAKFSGSPVRVTRK